MWQCRVFSKREKRGKGPGQWGRGTRKETHLEKGKAFQRMGHQAISGPGEWRLIQPLLTMGAFYLM
jgi:hypothetical protein